MSSINGPWVGTLAVEAPCLGKNENLHFIEYYKDSDGKTIKVDYCCPNCAASGKEYKLCYYCGKNPRMCWIRYRSQIRQEENTGYSKCQECNDKDRAKYTNLDVWLLYCAKCNRSAKNLRRCSKCKNVYYCSIDCQRADWHKHKPLCGTI